VLAQEWQTVPKKGVVSSCEPLKFLWAPTTSLEWLKLEWWNWVRR